MTDGKRQVVYVAAYEDVTRALADLDAIEQLHKDEMIGSYEAAVIDKETGKPHIVKRMDRPRSRIIAGVFGSGTLPRKQAGTSGGRSSVVISGQAVPAGPATITTAGRGSG